MSVHPHHHHHRHGHRPPHDGRLDGKERGILREQRMDHRAHVKKAWSDGSLSPRERMALSRELRQMRGTLGFFLRHNPTT